MQRANSPWLAWHKRLLISTLIICIGLIGPSLPTRAVSSGIILWSADTETGDLSQWTADEGGGPYNTGTGSVVVADKIAHTGRYSVTLTITDADGQMGSQAARLFRWDENPKEAYYSAWFYFPIVVKPIKYWNVFQFKSKSKNGQVDPMWVLNVDTTNDDKMHFYLWDSLTQKPYDIQLTPTPIIPVKQWVHIEAFYRRATDNTGRITIWQDNIKILDIDGVQTATTDTVLWSVDNYTDGIFPPSVTIYVDDAVISTVRLGIVDPQQVVAPH